MRADEIKFKAQREDGKGWVYGDLIHGVNHKSGKTYILPVVGGVWPLSGCDPLDGYEVYPETICQFTTLKDKNDVEIYKDDKFQYHKHKGYFLPDFTGEILFRDGCFGYVATYENMGEAFHSFSEFDELQVDFLDHIEVIGNIHDRCSASHKFNKMDELLKQAIEITIENGSGSTSLLQRRLILGYNKACRLMDEMERLGVVGKMNGLKPRELLVKSIDDVKWVQT